MRKPGRPLVVGTAVVMVAGAVGWFAGTRSSPDARARDAASGTQFITAPVERLALTSDVVVRGTVRYGAPQAVTLPSSAISLGTAIVTRAPARGAALGEGAVALTVSGRPVHVLEGARPAFRDIGPGSRGPDVEQLEASLARLGYAPGPPDGLYDATTAAAVSAWYRATGWTPFGPTDDQVQALRAVEADHFAGQLERVDAEEALANARARLATATAEVARANTAVGAAAAGRRAVQIQLDAAGATQPPLSPAEQTAIANALTEATRAIDAAAADLAAAEAARAGARSAVEVAQRRATSATRRERMLAKVVDTTAAGLGVQVPADEVLFFPHLPVRVDDVGVKTGELASGPVMTVTNSQLGADAALSANDAGLVRVGTDVTVEAPELGIGMAGAVGDVARTPESDGVDAGRFHVRVELKNGAPESLAGASVVITIAVGSTEGEVLAVPVAALSVAGRGRSRVQVQERGGATREVTVERGLAAKGMVAVTPIGGRLVPGDLVVTGRDATVANRRVGAGSPVVRLPDGKTSRPAPGGVVARPQSLADVLLAAAPEGFVELGGDVAPSGPLDLERWATLSDDPARDRELLSFTNFVRGHVRSWERPGPNGTARMVASVLEFNDASGAVTFLVRKKDQTISEDGGVAFPVTGGIGLRFVHRTGDGLVHAYTIAFHAGNRLFYLGAIYPSEQPPDDILDMEARQRAQIASSPTDAG